MLKLKNVSKYYHANEVVALGLRKVNLDFELGEFVAVTGESGSGKSTLLNVISGLDTYEDGEMFIQGEETSYYSVADWESYRRQYIGFVFQNYNIIDSYSVLENVEVALRIQGYDKEKRRERALELIKKVGLETHIHHKASKLSGGQKQRAVIARALAKDCPVIVCDEPTGNLDSESSEKVLSLLAEISKDKLVIVVTHNYEEVEKYATRRIRLFDGEVIEDKKVKAHQKSELVTNIQSYMMDTFDLITIGAKNLFKTPRRSIFTISSFLLIVAVFTLIYGFFVSISSEAGGSSSNYLFNNVSEHRIIVTKFDETIFTDAELDEINGISNTLGILKHDVVNDKMINRYFVYEDREYKWMENYQTYMNPSFILGDVELTDGRSPESMYEVVIQEQEGIALGDKVYFGFDYRWFDEGDMTYEEYFKENFIEFTVVGFIAAGSDSWWRQHGYFHEDFLNSQVVINKSYISGEWDSIYRLDLYVTEYTNAEKTFNDYLVANMQYMKFEIDDRLADGEMVVGEDTLYNLGRFMMEVEPTFDIVANPDYYKDLDLHINSISAFTDDEVTIKIVDHYSFEWNETKFEYEYSGYDVSDYVTPKEPQNLILLNENTYKLLIEEESYQATVYAKNVFEAEKIVEDLEALGYNAIYPRNVEDPFAAFAAILLNILFGFLMVVLMIIVYFITFLVLRNIQESKKKDFLILRSIGASKSSLNKVTVIELMIGMAISIAIIYTFLVLNMQFKWVKWMYDLLTFFTVGNYIFLFVLLLALTLFLGRRFNNRIFNKSVITSLKSE